MRCVDVSPTYNDYQQYNTQREKQLLGKWFNIGDRSKKLHHTITYVTKISLFQLHGYVHNEDRRIRKNFDLNSKKQTPKVLTNTFIHLK